MNFNPLILKIELHIESDKIYEWTTYRHIVKKKVFFSALAKKKTAFQIFIERLTNDFFRDKKKKHGLFN